MGTISPPSLARQIDAAVNQAVTRVMTRYAGPRAPRPCLAWMVDPADGSVRGIVPADVSDGDAAGVLERWAQLLGLAPALDPLSHSAEYAGTVDDQRVVVWGVVDRAGWDRDVSTILARASNGREG